MKIWAVTKDPGGTNGILPVVNELRVRGHKVSVYASGKAVEILTKQGIPHIAANTISEMGIVEQPDVVLTTMCSDDGLGLEIAKDASSRTRTKVVALQDMWGARLPEWRDGNPDIICTGDEIGAELIQKAWPEFPPEKIATTGWPALDRYAALTSDDLTAKRALARTRLGIPKDQKVILYSGSIRFCGQAMQKVTETVQGLIDKDTFLVTNPHPRMEKDGDPEEVRLWHRSLDNLPRAFLVQNAGKVVSDPSDLIAASDVFVALFSTMLIEAVAMYVSSICLEIPGCGDQIVRDTFGPGGFPLAQMGCCLKATSSVELERHILSLLSGEVILREVQKEKMRLDGQNAKRVAEIVHRVGWGF